LLTIHVFYNLLKWAYKRAIFNDVVVAINKAYVANQISTFVTATGCCLILL